MPNELSNLFDIELSFNLCKQIIRQREFQSLIELDHQCKLLLEKVPEAQGGQETQTLILTPEEDGLSVLLYYIYYLMLDKKERAIFKNLEAFILKNNFSIYTIYSNFNCEDSELEFETRMLFKYALMILNKYMNNTEITDVDIEKVNKFILYIYEENYGQISTVLYLIFILAFGLYDVGKYLSEFSQEVVLLRFFDISNILIDRFETEPNSFTFQEGGVVNNDYFDTLIDDLRF